VEATIASLAVTLEMDRCRISPRPTRTWEADEQAGRRERRAAMTRATMVSPTAETETDADHHRTPLGVAADQTLPPLQVLG